jgi:hypothetical protein
LVTTRFFTPDEANALLAEVRPLAERMVEHRRKLGDAVSRRSEVTAIVEGNGGSLHAQAIARLDEQIEAAAAGVRSCIEAIEDLGGVVKDLDRGLVDFPALRDDEVVLLCWQLGEEEIGFWHGLDEGFAGRRELPL